ncbi:MAG: 16S rRNA processing protein RimM [Alphaproteobacteria bacterium]|nr:16S rRNA processing protein RimM [Alphaproteobacteria bacterium]
MTTQSNTQTPPPSEKRICLGVIAQAHGVKGLVKILPYGDDPYLIELVEEFEITLKNPHGKYFLAEIAGIDSREAVDAIKGTQLFIDRDQLPDPNEGEYYIEDLVGMKAVNIAGKDAGVVIAVHNFGAGDLLEIKPPSGEAYLVPFTDDHVPEVRDDSVTVIPMIDGIG